MKSFSYRDLKGMIDIVTISPNEKYFYRVQKPVSINMTNFACKVAFYNRNEHLLYFRNNVFAHWLKPWQIINLVLWSKQGNMAYFYEYSRNEVYESVFLNLNEKYCYRIDETQNNFAFVNSLLLIDREYNEDTVMKKLEVIGLQKHPLVKDGLPSDSLLTKLVNRNKWYP